MGVLSTLSALDLDEHPQVDLDNILNESFKVFVHSRASHLLSLFGLGAYHNLLSLVSYDQGSFLHRLWETDMASLHYDLTNMPTCLRITCRT